MQLKMLKYDCRIPAHGDSSVTVMCRTCGKLNFAFKILRVIYESCSFTRKSQIIICCLFTWTRNLPILSQKLPLKLTESAVFSRNLLIAALTMIVARQLCVGHVTYIISAFKILRVVYENCLINLVVTTGACNFRLFFI